MSQENIALVKGAYEAFQRGDIDAVMKAFDPNIEWYSPGPAELPTAGKRRGQAEVSQFFAALDGFVEFQRFEPKEFLAAGDKVIVLGQDTSRVKATGRVVESEWAHVHTIHNGKVARFHEYSDTSPLVAALQKEAV